MRTLIITLILTVITFVGCSSESEKETSISDNEKLTVVSVNYPLHYFAEKIGGDLIDAIFPVPGNIDPAYWRPNEKDILVYQSADLVLLNGADYAKWVKKTSLPKSKSLNTSKKFSDSYLESDETTTHSHGPEGEHEHKGIASTTWLSFKFAADQASLVRDELISKLPDNKSEILKNYTALESDLLDLDERMMKISSQLGGTKIIGSHPVFQYLSSRYNLNIESLHWEPDEMPEKSGWHNLEQILSKSEQTILLWEAEPLPEITKKLHQMKVKVAVFELCANSPENGDFISKMEENIDNLQNAIK